MKVAFSLTQCAHAVPGGTAVAALELRRAILSSAASIEVVSVGAQRGKVPAPLALPDPSARFTLPYPLLYDLWNRTDRGRVDRLVPDADLVHMTLGFCAARGAAPQVCTVHDMFPFTHPEVFTKRGARVMTDGLTRVFERADIIAAPSQASADAIVSHGGIAPDRVRVVPWGAAPNEFADSELGEIQRRLGLPERFVIFAGTQEPRKNLAVLLDALPHLDEGANLVLAGPAGWGDVGGRLNETSSERLLTLGSLERRDLLGAMTLASALVMPSLAEGFGLPALEAMAQGTPVIHSECSALRELAGETGTLVESTDAAGWAREINSFCKDDGRSSELGQASRIRSSSFSWGESAKKMIDVYEELV